MFKSKSCINDKGRECTVCGEYKERDYFSVDRSNKIGRSSNCLICRNKSKKEARAKDKTKDTEYRINKRKLEIGQIIVFYEPFYFDGLPREDKWEVIGYRFKKGYSIRSLFTKEVKRLDTGDNPQNPNCRKFYKVQDKEVISLYEKDLYT